MATAFNQLVIRGNRRVRLLFTGPLAAGAFTSTSYYAAVNTDGTLGPPITVDGVYAIVSDPNAAEISLSQDFIPGALYTITVTSVPTVDASDPSGSLQITIGLQVQTAVDEEPEVDDFELLLYGEDLFFNGDYVEDPTGDLETISGRDNWEGAIERRELSNGIYWDQAYGAKSYQYVDAPQSLQLALAGNLVAQAKADNRTKQATCTTGPMPSDPGGYVFLVTVVGKDGLDPATVTVPSPTQAAP